MFITIHKALSTPMIRQIYSSIRDKILSGQIEPQSRIPSSRQLATELEISRIVVVEAYEQLLAEGYLYAINGSGTFVENIQNITNLHANEQPSPSNDIPPMEMRSHSTDGIIDIRTGAPDLSLFPIAKWGALYKNICQDIDPTKLDYYNPEGSYELRSSLLKYLNTSRGIVAQPQQVFITTGAAQVFTLLSRLLLDSSEQVIVEDPINSDIYSMLISTGAEIVPIPVDNKGIMTSLLPTDNKAKLIFTTPSHQFPMGSILSIKRRLKLIEYARQSDGYIIEDDYDSAFRFSGSPVSALHTLDSNRVIYTGTFSKLLFPALRIGYVILPMELVEPFKKLKHLEDLHTTILEQLTLSRFIADGHFHRHISKCRKVYRAKNKALVTGLKDAFGSDVNILGDSAGIHLVAEFPKVVFDSNIIESLYTFGLKISPIEPHTKYPNSHIHRIMIGYGHLTLIEIDNCIKILHHYIT